MPTPIASYVFVVVHGFSLRSLCRLGLDRLPPLRVVLFCLLPATPFVLQVFCWIVVFYTTVLLRILSCGLHRLQAHARVALTRIFAWYSDLEHLLHPADRCVLRAPPHNSAPSWRYTCPTTTIIITMITTTTTTMMVALLSVIVSCLIFFLHYPLSTC